MKSITFQRVNHAAGYLGVGVVLSLVIFMSLNARTGPHAQVTGIVQGVTFVQTDGPASKLLVVKLDNGDVIHVGISPLLRAQPGETIVLDVYRRMLTGSRTYTMTAADRQPDRRKDHAFQKGSPP
jgi:hypothetical protein